MRSLTFMPPLGAHLLQRRPYGLRRRRHGELLGTDRVRDSIHDGGGRRDGAGLAASLDAERVRRAPGYRHVDLERREVVRLGHGVVHERAAHDLAAAIIAVVVGTGLA